MPTQKSAPRRRRGQQQDEADLGDGRGWPMLRHQQALLAQLPGGEAAAAERRAQVLVTHGWGALKGWLEQQSEQPAAGCRRAAVDSLADLFDVA
jgi:hypothetical protein